jgi:hypothetical protein
LALSNSKAAIRSYCQTPEDRLEAQIFDENAWSAANTLNGRFRRESEDSAKPPAAAGRSSTKGAATGRRFEERQAFDLAQTGPLAAYSGLEAAGRRMVQGIRDDLLVWKKLATRDSRSRGGLTGGI